MSTCSNLGSSLFCSGSSTAVIQSLQSLLSVAMRAAPPPWPAADASTPPSELDLDGETGVAAPPPPHAVQRHAMMPFAVRAAPCRCDHGGPGCSFAARPGLDLSGAAHTRCQHCSFRAVEVLGAEMHLRLPVRLRQLRRRRRRDLEHLQGHPIQAEAARG